MKFIINKEGVTNVGGGTEDTIMARLELCIFVMSNLQFRLKMAEYYILWFTLFEISWVLDLDMKQKSSTFSGQSKPHALAK